MSRRSLKPAGRIGVVTGILILVVLGLLVGFVVWPRATDSMLRKMGMRVKKVEHSIEEKFRRKKNSNTRQAGAADPAKKKKAILGKDGSGLPPKKFGEDGAGLPPSSGSVRRSSESSWTRGRTYAPARVDINDVRAGTQQAISGAKARVPDFSKNLVKSYQSDTLSSEEAEIMTLLSENKIKEANARLLEIGRRKDSEIKQTAYPATNISQNMPSLIDRKTPQVDLDAHELGSFAGDKGRGKATGIERLYSALGDRNAENLRLNKSLAASANSAAKFGSEADFEENRLKSLAIASMGSDVRAKAGSLGVRPNAPAALQKGSVDKLMLAVHAPRGATNLMRTDKMRGLTNSTGITDETVRYWYGTPRANKVAQSTQKGQALRCGNVTAAQWGAAFDQKTRPLER